jgi:hypothetical protein
MQSKSLNCHYARNPTWSTFVRDVGSGDLQHFGLAALTRQHSTCVGGVDTPHESSIINTPGKQYSKEDSEEDEADILSSPGNHEQTNMSFSFCFSHDNNAVSYQLGDSFDKSI